MAGWIRMAVGMDVDVDAGVEFRGRMVLRDVQNGSLQKWCESVELECVWKRVFVAVFVASNGSVETGNDRRFPCG